MFTKDLDFCIKVMASTAGACRVIEHSEGGYVDARNDLRAAFEELDGLLAQQQKRCRFEEGADRRKTMSNELTREQIERLDFMHNLGHDLICDLAGKDELEWDMEVIGEVVDVIESHVCGKLKLMTEQEFNPFMVEEEQEC